MKSQLLELFNKLNSKTVFFGPQGFSFADSLAALDEFEKSYNIDGWKNSWVTFCQDTELGDPYFIDTLDSQYPVYTAMHGEGGWEKELVSSSLEGFIECMNILNNASNQEYAQIIPDESTITDGILLNALKIKLIESSKCKEFWDMFFACYLDWLEED